MDLTQFNLQGLQSLHISFKNVLKDHEEQFNNLSKNDDFYQLKVEHLIEKIEYFKVQIKLIEKRINELNEKSLRFSVEFMFWNYGAMRSSVQVHFLTTSKSYEIYGSYVTGQVLFDKVEYPELIERVSQKQHNDGVIRFEEIVSDRMSDEIKEILRTEGFKASEIDHIF